MDYAKWIAFRQRSSDRVGMPLAGLPGALFSSIGRKMYSPDGHLYCRLCGTPRPSRSRCNCPVHMASVQSRRQPWRLLPPGARHPYAALDHGGPRAAARDQQLAEPRNSGTWGRLQREARFAVGGPPKNAMAACNLRNRQDE